MTTTNPFLQGDFANFDFAKFMDPAKYVEQMESWNIAKLTEQFNVPGVDADAIVNMQRKNIEAITAANRVAIEGAQALVQRQGEIIRETLQETSKAVSELATVEGPDAKFSKQAELAKAAYEKAVGNLRELTEMSTKSNTQAAEVLSARVSEGLDELKAQIKMVAKPKKK